MINNVFHQIIQKNDELERVLEKMAKQQATECFQKLFCGIASHPGDFDENVYAPMLESIKLAENLALSDKSADVASKLTMAMEMGSLDETGTACVAAFKGCQYDDIQIFQSIVRAPHVTY